MRFSVVCRWLMRIRLILPSRTHVLQYPMAARRGVQKGLLLQQKGRDVPSLAGAEAHKQCLPVGSSSGWQLHSGCAVGGEHGEHQARGRGWKAPPATMCSQHAAGSCSASLRWPTLFEA